MKKIVNMIVVLMAAVEINGQATQSENYVSTKTYLDYPSFGNPKVDEKVEYMDGLGRPKQVVQVQSTPGGKDLVTHFEYDMFGRVANTYLPVPKQGSQYGGIYTIPLDNSSSVYGSEKIYSEKIYENSPLNKVLKEVSVGLDWSSRGVIFEEGVNEAGDEVKIVIASTAIEDNAVKTSIQVSPDYYNAGLLYKKTVWDEDGNKSIEFKNGKGQLIVSRKPGFPNADTYYIYNEYGQLAWVIPPLLADKTSWSDNDLAALAYEYRYDGRGRQVEKKLPGKGREYMVYNRKDQLILTQDTVMQSLGEWQFVKYDELGREVYTGITRNTMKRKNLQVFVDNTSGAIGEKRVGTYDFANTSFSYSNETFPTDIKELLTIKYYDYFPESKYFNGFKPVILDQRVLAPRRDRRANGLPAASFVRNIEDTHWSETYFAYDTRGREISRYSVNYLKGSTTTETQLNFSGLPNTTITYHRKKENSPETKITETFEYDNQNRVKKHWHQVNTEPAELLTENKYNEISQIERKKVGNSLQSIDYKYNIRGWNTQINDPDNLNGKLFGYKIKYQNPEVNIFLRKFNGNISEIDWKTAIDGNLKRYSYEYDQRDRLLKGVYSEPFVTAPANNAYNESLSYDLNGNISSLRRNGLVSGLGQQIDYLMYDYDGNRLIAVTDHSGNYEGYPESSGSPIAYDDNGNMTDHIDKGIKNISYNHLNLPHFIEFNKFYVPHADPNGLVPVTVTYVYAADGRKLYKRYTYGTGSGNTETTKVTDYLDGFQYTDDVLSFVPTSEGYYDFVEKKYIYHYTDHLGNIRLSYMRNLSGTAQTIEENNYYPFGLRHASGGNSGNPAYQYKYNGKELQETGMYDYGARMYMPDIGRWGVIDPASELSRRWSTYTYVYNNPIRFIDPDGRFAVPPDDYIDASTGKYLGSDGAATTNVRTIYKSDWNNITSEKGGSISADATAALQKSSSIVTVNTGQISSDINSANNETIGDQTKERQLYLGLDITRGDIPTAQVTSVRGQDGVDGEATFSIGRIEDKSGNVIKQTVEDSKMILLGGAHTHNTVTTPGMKNDIGTSSKDVSTAKKFNTTVYSIDSWTGTQKGGNAIHRTTGGSVQTNNVGTTTGFNMGHDALRIFVDQQKKP